MKPATLIFDLDGTLLDSAPGIRSSLQYAAMAVNVAGLCSIDGIEIGPPIQEMFTAVLPGAERDLITSLVAAYRSHYDTVGWRDTQLYTGVIDVLHTLKRSGYDLYVATNKPERVMQQMLLHFRLGHFFTEALSVDVTDMGRADKTRLVGQLLQDRRIAPESALLVGDGASDAAAAQRNGLNFVWAQYGYGDRTKLGAYRIAQTIREPRELLSFCALAKT